MDWLHVEGNKVVDPTGRPVLLRGVNIENREWLWSVGEYRIDWELKAIPVACAGPPGGWGANVITLAVASGPVNRGNVLYLDFLDRLVDLAASYGAYTALIYRYAEPNIEQPRMPDYAALTAMTTLAGRYADQPAVLYGLQVEPHDVEWPTLVTIFQNMIDSIRQINDRAICIVPGTQWSRFVYWNLSSPVDRPNCLFKVDFYDHAADLEPLFHLSDMVARYPVWFGEFGVGMESSTEDVTGLLDRCAALGLGWCAFLFHYKGSPTLLADESFMPTPGGQLVKDRLALSWWARQQPSPPFSPLEARVADMLVGASSDVAIRLALDMNRPVLRAVQRQIYFKLGVPDTDPLVDPRVAAVLKLLKGQKGGG